MSFEPKQPRLTPLTMAGLAAPALPLAALTLPLVTFIPEHYANALGMDLAVVGLIFMVVRLLDIGVDPWIGGLMDRTRTRWGRFRPWLLAGAPLIMAGTSLLFFAQPGVSAVHLLVALLLTYAGYSILTLAQLALSSAMSNSYTIRSRVFAWWQVATTLGIVLVLLLPTLLGTGIHNIVPVMGWSILITTPICVLMCMTTVRDAHAPETRPHAGLRQYVALLKRPSARRVILAQLLIGLVGGVTAASGIFFFITVKGQSLETFAHFTLILFLAGVVVAPAWSAIARRIGKHVALVIALLLEVAFLIVSWSMPFDDMVAIAVLAAVGGVTFTGMSLLPPAMLSDVADEELLETGVDRTGLLFALLTGIHKIGQAVSVGLVYAVLDVIDFDPRLGLSNPDAAKFGVGIVYCLVSGLFAGGAILAMIGYKLTAERAEMIRLALNDRGTGSAAMEGALDDPTSVEGRTHRPANRSEQQRRDHIARPVADVAHRTVASGIAKPTHGSNPERNA